MRILVRGFVLFVYGCVCVGLSYLLSMFGNDISESSFERRIPTVGSNQDVSTIAEAVVNPCRYLGRKKVS